MIVLKGFLLYLLIGFVVLLSTIFIKRLFDRNFYHTEDEGLYLVVIAWPLLLCLLVLAIIMDLSIYAADKIRIHLLREE